jgi:hypothetical protein
MKPNKMKKTIGLLGAALLASHAFNALAQDTAQTEQAADQAAPAPAAAAPRGPSVIELRQRANAAYAAGEHAALLEAAQQLHQMRPWNPEYMSFLVVAHALNGDRTNAYNMMLAMQRQGLSFDFNSTADTESLRGTEVYDYVNDLMIRAGEPAGVAQLEFQLPADLLLPTAMTWDPTREAFLVANARDGAVFSVGADGATQTLLEANENNGLWAIFGLQVDVANDRLWLTTAASPNFKGFREEDAGRSALVEFELESLELVKRYPVPADGPPHRLGDVALAGGDVFAVDTVLPIIYRLQKGDDRLRAFVAAGDNVSLRGITASDDGGSLYVSDYEMGVLVLDLENARATRLVGPETLNLGGIEGIEYWNGHLVIIQNGIRPQRIMRLQLGDDGATVANVAPLAIAQPFFDYPNFGTVHGTELVFFANSHWISNQAEPQPIRVASTNIETAPDLTAPDTQKFWEEYYESQGQTMPSDPGSQP